MSPAEYASAYGFNPSYDMPTADAAGEESKKHTDNEIQTLLYPDQMERKLAGVRDGARTAQQEMGVSRCTVYPRIR